MLKELPLTKYDEDINTIATYQPIPFTPEQGDAGYAIRVIEIYRLKKMAPLLEQFELLTGYATSCSNCTPCEINTLIERGQQICKQEEIKVKAVEHEISQLNIELNNAQRGVSSLSSYNGNIRELMSNLNDRVENAKLRLENTKASVSARKGLLGLLRRQVEQMLSEGGKGFKGKVMELLPMDYLPSETYQGDRFSSGLTSHKYAWKELNKLELALKNILEKCTVPKDKYSLNNGGEEISLLSKQYYQIESESMRSKMSLDDFVGLMKKKSSWLTDKTRAIKNSL
ncbi:hypothetical protein [Yersinia frederiksenii]|uniref:hypothetical protein n=1 Tax=Yersinia frederiksenii TaxID=29484 RepID=UPI0005E47311|nr:hypothetical protein [Yersinia frederiksenii]CNF90858.1 Uncharacterised protein [Yersinia frederiksenii]